MGALVTGLVADRLGAPVAIWVVAVITVVSGLVVLVRMREGRPERDPGRLP